MQYGVRLVCCSQRLRCWSASASFTPPTSPRARWPTRRRSFWPACRPSSGRRRRFPSTSDERLHWHFIPTEMFPRNGLTIAAMSPSQRKLAHDLLRAGLSQRGYLTATAIMDLETLLGALEAAARIVRQPGRPGDADGPRSGGLLLLRVRHAVAARHLGLARRGASRLAQFHRRQRDALSPRRRRSSGSNPAEVRDGPKKGLRILAAEEDSARALLMALDAAQRAKAVISADRAERHRDDEHAEDRSAVAGRHRRQTS